MVSLNNIQPIIGGPLSVYRLGDLILQTGAHEYVDRYKVLTEDPFSRSLLHDYLVGNGFKNYISARNVRSEADMKQRKLWRRDICFNTITNVVNKHKLIHNIVPQKKTIFFSIRAGDIVDHPNVYHHCNIFLHNHANLVDEIYSIVQNNNITDIKCTTCLRYPNHDHDTYDQLSWCAHYSDKSRQHNIDLLTHLFTAIENKCNITPTLKPSTLDPIKDVDNDFLTMVYNQHTIPDNKNSKFNNVIRLAKNLINT